MLQQIEWNILPLDITEDLNAGKTICFNGIKIYTESSFLLHYSSPVGRDAHDVM